MGSRSLLTAFPAWGGVRGPPVLVLVPAAHGASGDGDTFVVTPGGACVEHGGAWGSTRLAARVARAPPSAACAPRATARPDSPHSQNTPARERATSALVAEAREVGVLSFSRARDAATRVAVSKRAPARVRLSRSARRCVRELRDTRGTPALLMCPSVPALRAWLSPRCVRNAAWAAAHRGIRPSRHVRSLSSASRGRTHSEGTRQQGPPPRARFHVHVRVR